MKIQRAERAVASCIDIAKGCQQHFALHTESNWPASEWHESANILELYGVAMRRHRQHLEQLDIKLHKTFNLVCVHLSISDAG